MGATVPAVMTQSADEVVNLVPCSSCARKHTMTTLFEVGRGYVPPLAVLYQDIRRTGVDRRFPLLEEEILPRERCLECVKRVYQLAYKTQDALRLMAQWWDVVRHTRWERDQAKLQAKEQRRQKRLEEKIAKQLKRLAGESLQSPRPVIPIKKYGDERPAITAAVPSKKNRKKESQKERGNRRSR